MAGKIQQRSYGGPDVLELVDVERPDPAELASGQVLVRVAAAGVNPVDTQARRGESVAELMGGFPFTVGWDLAGTVEALGPDARTASSAPGTGTGSPSVTASSASSRSRTRPVRTPSSPSFPPRTSPALRTLSPTTRPPRSPWPG